MNMNDFEAILETCVDQIASGEASLEECLARSPCLRGRIRAELNHAVKDSSPQKRGLPLFFWRMALNVAVLLFALMMTNTVFAQGALPGDSLYNWKLTSERVWRAFATDQLAMDLKLSDRRIDEYVAVSSDETRRARVLVGYNELLVRFQAEEDEADRARILTALKSQQDSLRKVGLSIPELESYFSGGATETGGDFQVETPETPVIRPVP